MSAGADSHNLSSDVTKFSEVLAKPIEQLFRVGGLVLVFVFLGFLAMLTGHLYANALSPWLFGVGAFIIFACLCLFLYGQLYGQTHARRLLRENKEIMDSVQEMAIGLTESISDLQSLMFKHSEQVAVILETAAPLLSQIPILSEADFLKTQNINTLIVTTTEKSRQVIDDVRQALVTCEVGNLRQYAQELELVRTSLREALKARDSLARRVPNYKEMAVALQQTLLEYSKTVDHISSESLRYFDMADAVAERVRGIPFVGNQLDHFGFTEAKRRSADMRQLLVNARKANAGFQAALAAGDIQALKASLARVSELNLRLGAMGAARGEGPARQDEQQD